MSRTVRLLMPVVVAVALGPLIAGLAVCVLAIVSNLFNPIGSLPIADLFPMFGVYIIFAYMLGSQIALLAGILVSLWMISRPPDLIVVVAAALLATAVFLGLSALGVLGLAELTNARANFLLIPALAVIAAIGCWLLTRRFALQQQPPAIGYKVPQDHA
jgi:hypothetical protein